MPVRIDWPLLGATVLPNVGGWAGAYYTKKNMPWYETLKKPTWNPPKWMFGPVWTGLYCTMGYSSYLVWRDGGGFKEAAGPLAIYGLNLALNWTWTPLFFGCRSLKWSLYEIVALCASTAAVGIAFYNVNHVAGYLIVPYFAWTSLATALNYVIYRDNKEQSAIEKSVQEKK
ncbi:translocator protein [Pseudomyrmex gracilis]|uniref:translocator protein n=1 Tax=Pseudomyrmex gracilis TaxID=219809 RepID=UPI0009956BA5|nr:translocator protein [Pseudomyrmex gracilis]